MKLNEVIWKYENIARAFGLSDGAFRFMMECAGLRLPMYKKTVYIYYEHRGDISYRLYRVASRHFEKKELELLQKWTKDQEYKKRIREHFETKKLLRNLLRKRNLKILYSPSGKKHKKFSHTT